MSASHDLETYPLELLSDVYLTKHNHTNNNTETSTRTLTDLLLIEIFDLLTPNTQMHYIYRTCCGTLEGHESTVWCIDFEASGDRLGK